VEAPDLIAGRFVLEALVGEGGMGRVFRGRDRASNQGVAIKLVPVRDDLVRRRIQQEAQVLRELEHPGIVRYIGHGALDDHHAYLVMEWLEGEDLSSRLAQGPLDLDATLTLGQRVAAALGHAHDHGIVHRDVKPSNLFLVNGDVAQVRLLDFGVARGRALTSRATRTGMAVGTPAYMSPEQAIGTRDVDARADVFALGCVIYECLAGRPAFGGEHVMAVLAKILVEPTPSLRQVITGSLRGLDQLLERMLAKDRGERPSDGRAVSELLGELRGREHDARHAADGGLTSAERRRASILLISPSGGEIDGEGSTVLLGHDTSWFTPVAEVVRAHGAELLALADGSALALFQGERWPTDQAALAAGAAWAVHETAPWLAVALATGRLEVGNSAPMGESIDRAAQLVAAAARPDGPCVLVDEATAGLLDARFALAPHALGFVLGRGGRSPTLRTLLGRRTPCVGREAELAALEARLSESVEDSVARAVLITGAAGVGKTRLVAELLARLSQRPRGAVVWMARGDAMRSSAYHVLADALAASAGVVPGEAGDLRRRKLLARVQRNLGGDVDRVASFLIDLLGVGTADGDRPDLAAARDDPELMSDQLRSAWLDLLVAECAAQPLVLVLEDLQWADRPSVAVVNAALTLLADRPFFVVALARPEVSTPFADSWSNPAVTTIPLGGLSRRAAERLIASVLGELPKAAVERLVRLAGGNAFFLEELMRCHAEGTPDVLPDTVLGAVEARLANLGSGARRVLRAASIFGASFTPAAVATLVSGELAQGAEVSSDVAADLDALVAAEVLLPSSTQPRGEQAELGFQHALLREAAYAMLTDDDRRRGHAIAARYLEHAGETDPALLADHADRGGDAARAVSWYQRAAEKALDANDLEAVVARVAAAERCGARGEVLGRLRALEAHAHHWRGDNDHVLEVVEHALRLAPRGSKEWCLAAADCAHAAAALGELALLERLGEQIAGLLLDPAPSAAATAAAAVIARRLDLVGKYTVSERLLALTEQVLATQTAVPALAQGLLFLAKAVVALRHGDAMGYLEITMAARRAFESVGDARRVAHASHNIGDALIGLGDFDTAQRELRQVLAQTHQSGLGYLHAGACQNLGLALLCLGHFAEAIAYEQQAIAAFHALRDVRCESSAHVYLARALAASGDVDGAIAVARRACELSVELAPKRCTAHAMLGHCLLAAGDVGAALAAATIAKGLLDELGSIGEGRVWVVLTYAEALARAGRTEDARAAILEASELVLDLALRIRDEAYRERFLRQVPENARTLALAAAWSA
jgi:predicted ATPase